MSSACESDDNTEGNDSTVPKTITHAASSQGEPVDEPLYHYQRQNISAPLVRAAIKQKLWPKVKFVTADDMEYSTDKTSLVQRVCNLFNVHDSHRDWFWRSTKKIMRQGLAHRRSEVGNSIKLEFMSKLIVFVCNVA